MKLSGWETRRNTVSGQARRLFGGEKPVKLQMFYVSLSLRLRVHQGYYKVNGLRAHFLFVLVLVKKAGWRWSVWPE